MANRDSQEIARPMIDPVLQDDEAKLTGATARDALVPNGIPAESVEHVPARTWRIEFHATWTSIIIWATLIVLLVAFFAFGSVTIYPRNGLDRTMRVNHIWALFRDDLPNVHYPALLTVFFYGAIALMVIGMAWMIFLALGTRTVDIPDESASQSHSPDSATAQF